MCDTFRTDLTGKLYPVFKVVLTLLALSFALHASGAEFGNPTAQVTVSECIFQSGFECPPAPNAGPTIDGTVFNYWTLSPVADALVITLAPPTIAISNEMGDYLLNGFDPNMTVTINVSKSPLFRQTRSIEISIGEQSLDEDVFAAAESDIFRQFATVGEIEQDDRAIVIAEIRDSDQSPLEGIPQADIALTNDAMAPVGNGPYFFGSGGDIDANLNASAAFQGRGARFAFLNVPSGEVTLTIALPPPDSNLTVTFNAEPNVAHLVLLH